MTTQTEPHPSTEHMLLPVEILAHIFRATCCIDANFHLTLRLVSRLCRDIARPLKYCSLFIHGREHLHYIVRQLKQYPANIPLVEHATISDHCHQTRHDFPGHNSKPWPNRQPNLQMHSTARPDIAVHKDGEFEGDVRAFLDMVAPTLRTLYVALYSGFDATLPTCNEIFRPKNGRTYPKLQELGFRGSNAGRAYRYIPVTECTQGLIPAKTGLTTFPQLKRLWLSGGALYGRGSLLTDIAMGCPLLTHLRLHEEHSYTMATFKNFLDRFMLWHGVQIGSPVFVESKHRYSWMQRYQIIHTVAVLRSNPLLGFPHLQRVIFDMRHDAQDGKDADPDHKSYCNILQELARRRRDVVVKWCQERTRQRAPLRFVRDVFGRSVSGDPELWEPENKLFEEEADGKWRPLEMVLETDSRSSFRPNFRANISSAPPEQSAVERQPSHGMRRGLPRRGRGR